MDDREVEDMKLVIVLPLVVSMLFVPASAIAAGSPEIGATDELTKLVSAVAVAEQNLHRERALAAEGREQVNAAIAQAVSARLKADEARENERRSNDLLVETERRLGALQSRFDNIAAATYMSGPLIPSGLTADPTELMSAAALTQSMVVSRQNAADSVLRVRAQRIEDSQRAREAATAAERALAMTEQRRLAAVGALASAQRSAAYGQQKLNDLVAQRDRLREQLNALAGSQQSSLGSESSMVPRSAVDPAEAINRLIASAESSARATAAMGRAFLTQIGVAAQDHSPTSTRAISPEGGRIPMSAGQLATERVIARVLAQRGVDYAWGGGTATGPTRGIDDGANTVGFDCSGLILYAFAGVGIELPHYSGQQYEMGRKVPVAQMRRGDAVFYGEGGKQHVALYLGENLMVEAPKPGGVVMVSPLRASDIAPYAVRYIEA